MKTFKTPKGTELPIMDIKGKDYLQAAPRIFWMKEEHPDWSIRTEFLVLNEKTAVCKATITQEDGQILATATSMETIQGFESFVEKAETCAISRAASFCGYGTLMAQELEEQGKLADTPISSKGSNPNYQPPSPLPTPEGLAGTICPFGKLKGQTFEQAGRPALAKDRDYWLERSKIEKVSKIVQDYIDAVNRYL